MIHMRHMIAAIALLCAVVLAGCNADPKVTGPAATTEPAAPTVVASAAATAAPAATTAAQTTAPAATQPAEPYVTGLVLVAPLVVDGITSISNDTRDDGTYREEMLYDGMVGIVVERLKSVDATKEAVTQQIKALNETDVSGLAIQKDTAVTSLLTYPAWRLTYTTGSNEDTRTNVDVYVQVDGWDFRFHTSTPADAYDEYKESIEVWIESMALMDAE